MFEYNNNDILNENLLLFNLYAKYIKEYIVFCGFAEKI